MVDRKGISNVVCYDMLTQPRYKALFSYVPVFERNRIVRNVKEDNEK